MDGLVSFEGPVVVHGMVKGGTLCKGKGGHQREVIGIVSARHVVLDDNGMFRCDAIRMKDPVDTILAGFPGKSMIGSAGSAVKSIAKGGDRVFPGIGLMDKNFVMRRFKGGVEIAHENGGKGIGTLQEPFHDEFGAECLNRRRKIKMGVDTGHPVRLPLKGAHGALSGPLAVV